MAKTKHRKGTKRKGNSLRKAMIWLLFFGMIALIISPVSGMIRRTLGLEKAPEPETIVEERIIEKIVIPYYQPKENVSIGKVSNGRDFDFKSEVIFTDGTLASGERTTPGSYEAYYRLQIAKPGAATKWEEVTAMNRDLPKILPGLEAMMTTAKVSPFFETLYQNKEERVRKEAFELDNLLTKHNYYDCQTMLEMEHPDTGRKVFLLQADMDVVSDGSDGDRLPTMPDKIVNSTHYQPFTSYYWRKTGTTENPMLAGWTKRVENANQEIAKESTSAPRKAWLQERLEMLETGIGTMQNLSWLIAEYDPFIVMPVFVILDRESDWGPNVGDYVAVIYGNKIYPAIVGDAGPNFKVGEASLRMALEINSNSSSYSRPVSDLSVTYVVFPRSSTKWVVPNYDEWRNECEKLLNEIGGLGDGYELSQWKNLLPTPTDQPE